MSETKEQNKALSLANLRNEMSAYVQPYYVSVVFLTKGHCEVTGSCFCFTDNDPLSWDVEDDFMFDHEPVDPNHIGDDFEDLEQRRLDALCDLLFEGADHSESDRHSNHPHRSHHFPSDQPVSRPDAPWRETSGSLSLHERAGVSAPATRPAAQRTRPTQQTSDRSTLRSRLSLGTLFTGLLLAAFCFFKGASAPIESTRPIEDIRPGHKVIVDAPEEALATDVARLNGFESSWNASDGKLEVAGVADPLRELTETTNEQITKADYRLVILQAKEVWEDGTYNEINVQTLQPWQWIHQHEVHVGSQAPLPLETVEMNLPVGMTGKVLDILPCPQLEQGAGRTVLTTVNRLARGVIELSLRDADGNEETIRPTDEHLFYSKSHGDWLSAGELQPGEHLDGTDGLITVAAITPLDGTHRVYNFTVQGEHLYRVGNCGALVHNTCFVDKVFNHLPAYRKSGSEALYLDPFTNVWKWGKRSELAGDHLLSQKAIRDLLEQSGLGSNQQSRLLKELVEDPDNLELLPHALNSSKGSRAAENWFQYLKEKKFISRDYLGWLAGKQDEMTQKVLDRISREIGG